MSNGVVDQRRYGDRLRRSAVEKTLDLPVADHAIEQTVPASALARFEHGAHQRKHTGRLHQQPGRLVGHALPVQLGQPPVKIVVHQRDRELGRTLGDLNAEFAQGRGKFFGAFDIDRFDPHGTITEILFRDLKRQAEARPISGDSAIECLRCSSTTYRRSTSRLIASSILSAGKLFESWRTISGAALPFLPIAVATAQ